MTFNKHVKSIAWLLFEKGFSVISGLFVGVWITRYLGPELYGKYALAISVNVVIAMLCKLGCENLIVRELSFNSDEKEKVLGTFIINILCISVFFNLFIFLIEEYQGGEIISFLSILAIGNLFCMQVVIKQYYVFSVEGKVNSIISNIVSFFGMLAKIITIYYDFSIWGLLVCIVLEEFFRLAIYTYVLTRDRFRFSQLISNYSWSYYRSIWKSSFTMLITGLVIFINMRMDQFMINHMLGFKEVGIYSVGIRIPEALFFIPMIISSTYYSKALSYLHTSHEEFILYLEKVLSLSIAITIPITIALCFLSESIILNLYSSIYSDSINVFVIISFCIVLSSYSGINGSYLRAIGRESIIFKRQIINVILNFLLNLALIEKLGVNGAALSTLIAMFFSTIVWDLFDKSLTRLNSAKLNGTVNIKRLKEILV